MFPPQTCLLPILQSCSFQVPGHMVKPLEATMGHYGCELLAISPLDIVDNYIYHSKYCQLGEFSFSLSFVNTHEWSYSVTAVHSWVVPEYPADSPVNQA